MNTSSSLKNNQAREKLALTGKPEFITAPNQWRIAGWFFAWEALALSSWLQIHPLEPIHLLIWRYSLSKLTQSLCLQSSTRPEQSQNPSVSRFFARGSLSCLWQEFVCSTLQILSPPSDFFALCLLTTRGAACLSEGEQCYLLLSYIIHIPVPLQRKNKQGRERREKMGKGPLTEQLWWRARHSEIHKHEVRECCGERRRREEKSRENEWVQGKSSWEAAHSFRKVVRHWRKSTNQCFGTTHTLTCDEGCVCVCDGGESVLLVWNAEHVKSPRELLLQQSLIKETLALKQGYTARPPTHTHTQADSLRLTERDTHAGAAPDKIEPQCRGKCRRVNAAL